MKRTLWAFILVAASISLSGCGAVQVFGSKSTRTFTYISTPTKITPTSTNKPAPTKIEPTATSTETTKPTVDPGFRNPINAATEVFEGGVWYLKNAAGMPTAKWNTEIAGPNKWDTRGLEANITRTQVIVGNEVDRSILEPFLGPLPPDDPTTYFKDVNGYGIGPEITIETTGPKGFLENPTTEIFVRYRGTVIIPGSKNSEAVRIFEVPQADTSIVIVTMTLTTDEFSFIGSLGNSAVYNQNFKNSEGHKLADPGWHGIAGIQLANANFIGKIGAILLFHNTASLYPAGSDAQAKAAARDTYADSLIAYISGTSNQAPVPIPFSYQKGTGILPDLMFPEIDLPK